jgi:ERCC4-type nuclease
MRRLRVGRRTRRGATDFVASILDRRVFSQLATMKRTYARTFIIVEGDIHATRSMIAEDALLGALSYISVIESVPIFTTRDTAQTASMLLTMQRHALDGLGYEIALRGAKPKDRFPQSQYLVEGLPGIGPAAAKKLLAHFGTRWGVFSATPEQLRAVAGVVAQRQSRQCVRCSILTRGTTADISEGVGQ